MKFSIIIPALNEASSIGNTLDALLIQTYKNFEVIVVDNHSTDNTAEVVRKYQNRDERITLIPCPLRGVLHARSDGYKAATGDIIVQLDADNIPEKAWLAKAYKHLSSNKYVAVVGAYDYYDANIIFRYGGLLSQYAFLSLGNYYTQKRKFGALMIGGNAFIQKSALDAVGGYDISHTFYNDDLVIASAVSKIGQVKFFGDLTIRSSARRYKEFGYYALQKKYNRGTKAVLQGKPIPKQDEETNHPR